MTPFYGIPIAITAYFHTVCLIILSVSGPILPCLSIQTFFISSDALCDRKVFRQMKKLHIAPLYEHTRYYTLRKRIFKYFSQIFQSSMFRFQKNKKRRRISQCFSLYYSAPAIIFYFSRFDFPICISAVLYVLFRSEQKFHKIRSLFYIILHQMFRVFPRVLHNHGTVLYQS